MIYLLVFILKMYLLILMNLFLLIQFILNIILTSLIHFIEQFIFLFQQGKEELKFNRFFNFKLMLKLDILYFE